MLRGKAAVQTRRAVFGNEGGFNGDRAAAAEGIAEGVAPIVAGKLHHRGGKRFAQGRRHADRAVAALIQSLAGGIEPDDDLVLHDGKADLIPFSGFGQLRKSVFLSQPLNDRLFDNGLTRRHGVERGGDGISGDGEFAVAGDPVLPGDRARALKERFKVGCAEGAQHDDHARAAAQVDIKTRDVGLRPPAENAAVFHSDVGKPQFFDFISHQTFKPQQARNSKSKHERSPVLCFFTV